MVHRSQVTPGEFGKRGLAKVGVLDHASEPPRIDWQRSAASSTGYSSRISRLSPQMPTLRHNRWDTTALSNQIEVVKVENSVGLELP